MWYLSVYVEGFHMSVLLVLLGILKKINKMIIIYMYKLKEKNVV